MWCESPASKDTSKHFPVERKRSVQQLSHLAEVFFLQESVGCLKAHGVLPCICLHMNCSPDMASLGGEHVPAQIYLESTVEILFEFTVV